MTLDVKDAFLMSPQPAEERAYVRVNGRIFKLLRCLPGQRTAASQWFQHFAGACIEFGMKQDPMQPTLLYIPEELYLTVHVDDVFMVGIAQRIRDFVNYLKERKSWNVEEKGPFNPGERFHYLKREFTLIESSMTALKRMWTCSQSSTGKPRWMQTSRRRTPHLHSKEEKSQGTEALLAG